jgi:3-deoxy-manno-octulosonate cytidylyltransferase (CMP-KDO synthetase)
MRVLGVIPCRYGAVRFPGKPLADIHGKPMMWHVYMRARQARRLDGLVIATDDPRIEAVGRGLGLEMVMTGTGHPTGTDRVAECATRVDAAIYVNIQGDEPLIDPAAIDAVAEAIVSSGPETLASNGFNDITDPTNVVDTNVVKVVMALDGGAMAYSRSPIPFPKGSAVTYRRQLGLYAFRKEGLEKFAALPQGPLEAAEGVEMLRFLEHGHRVQMVRVPNDEAIPVDTPADLERIRELVAVHGMPG